MSPEGHLRRFDRAPLTSAVALKADIRLRRNVRRGGPQTDMSRCVRKIGSRKWTRLELPNASLRDLGELAAELSQRPAVRHADSRHLQSRYRTDRKTDAHFCRTPFNVRPGTDATAPARL
jgi:hypothetical protein